MPLDNTASIKDIITSLEDMQGINAKADLASVVGSPATADDSMATIVNKIQQAKNDLADKTEQDRAEPLQTLVNNMVVGKKWASGTTVSSPDRVTFRHIDNSTDTQFTVEVSDLGFIPSFIFLTSQTGGVDGITTYYKKVADTDDVVTVSTFSGTSKTQTVYFYQAQRSPAYVNDEGFLLPANRIEQEYLWFAFE